MNKVTKNEFLKILSELPSDSTECYKFKRLSIVKGKSDQLVFDNPKYSIRELWNMRGDEPYSDDIGGYYRHTCGDGWCWNPWHYEKVVRDFVCYEEIEELEELDENDPEYLLAMPTEDDDWMKPFDFEFDGYCEIPD